MSREDLRRLDARSQRRSWLLGAAKALARLAAAAALAAAGVVTMRAVGARRTRRVRAASAFGARGGSLEPHLPVSEKWASCPLRLAPGPASRVARPLPP
jgi:hypothetical protein